MGVPFLPMECVGLESRSELEGHNWESIEQKWLIGQKWPLYTSGRPFLNDLKMLSSRLRTLDWIFVKLTFI